MLLRDMIGAARCERIVYVDHVLGSGRELLEAVQQAGAEGIVSKRAGSAYRGGESRDWLKSKCHAIGTFLITGYSEMGEGRLEAIYVAEVLAGELRPVGQVRFGFAGKGLWPALDALRAGPRRKGGFIPVRLGLMAEVKFFGRHKGGYIRDGVILSLAAG